MINKFDFKTSLILLIALFTVLSQSCKKDNTDKAALETGTVIDVDSNVYKTVKIGGKWWMAENLKVKKFANGDNVEFVPSSGADTLWSHKKTSAYCILNEQFGLLYNYYSVADARKLAPTGWHIPSDDEWKELEMYLGMSKNEADKNNWRGNDQGNKLKVVGGDASIWAKSTDAYNVFGNNESGFSAMGGACRMFDGQWGDLTHTAFWWSSTVNDTNAWYRALDYDKANVFRYYGAKGYGFSVRCVKD